MLKISFFLFGTNNLSSEVKYIIAGFSAAIIMKIQCATKQLGKPKN
jgi:hypothetical protein